MIRGLRHLLFGKRRRNEGWKQLHVGKWDEMPALPGDDYAAVAETQGVTGGQDDRHLAKQRLEEDRDGIHLDKCHGEHHPICRILRTDNLWVMLQLKEHLQHMMTHFIGEAARWDLEGCGWSSAYVVGFMEDVAMEIPEGRHEIPFGRRFKIQGHILNPTRKSNESLEERLQQAHSAWYRDARICRSHHAP